MIRSWSTATARRSERSLTAVTSQGRSLASSGARICWAKFHITSDEAPTWNQIYSWLAAALGVEANLVHVAAETVVRVLPQVGPGVLGDRMNCAVFGNSKVKSVVPGFHARVPFVQGAAEIVDWYLADEGTDAECRLGGWV